MSNTTTATVSTTTASVQHYDWTTGLYSFTGPVSGPVINLTQHAATPEQVAAGVVDFDPETRARLAALLTFDTLEDASMDGITAKCHELAEIVRTRCALLGLKWAAVMIGGAPYLMGPLEKALSNSGARPVYAFSKRESVDEHMPDGSVVKRGVFRHAGFVDPCGLTEGELREMKEDRPISSTPQ